MTTSLTALKEAQDAYEAIPANRRRNGRLLYDRRVRGPEFALLHEEQGEIK